MIPPDANDALADFVLRGMRAQAAVGTLCPDCGRPMREEARTGAGARRWCCDHCDVEVEEPPLTCWEAGPCGTTCVGPAGHPEGQHTWVSDDDIVVVPTPLGKRSVIDGSSGRVR